MNGEQPDRKVKRRRRAWRNQAQGWLMIAGPPVIIALAIVFKSHLPEGVASWMKWLPLAWAPVVIFSCLILLGIKLRYWSPRKK